jgi:hypothetical protein
MSFTNSSYEKYIALFLSKPELFDKIHTFPDSYKQVYFFQRFYKFLTKYINITQDVLHSEEYLYVTCRLVLKQPLHAFNGKESRILFANEQLQCKKENDFLNKKYGFIESDDNRTFLGVKKIWLNPVLQQPWIDIVNNSQYDDYTFIQPFPPNLDKDFVPLNIRNKVLQLYKKFKHTTITTTTHEDMDMDTTTDMDMDTTTDMDTTQQNLIHILQEFEQEEW